MHDNSQVIAFLNVGVLPSCKLHSVAIECPPDVCILCYCVLAVLSWGEERGQIVAIRGNTRLWPPSADPPARDIREAPSVRGTSDIWSLAVKIERNGEWKEVWYGKLEDILLCRDWRVCPVLPARLYLETLGSFPRTATQPGATQPRPAQHWRRNTSSVETETRYPSHHRDQGVVTTVTTPTSGWRGPLWPASHLWQSSLMPWVYSESDVTGPLWLPLTASRHLHWPVNLLIRKFVCLRLETWALIGNLSLSRRHKICLSKFLVKVEWNEFYVRANETYS